jgi:SAM-dependent methyltransferase
MRAGNPAPDYALGSTDAERERLIRQAARFGPFTERLFREAGIGPGQRVLDLSSGVGNVAMLAARLVGPSGEVVGIERDTRSIARAKDRIAEAGVSNVSFIELDVSESAWSPIWSLPNEFLIGFSAAAGIAFINSVGNLGGFIGPYAMGAITEQPEASMEPWSLLAFRGSSRQRC